MPTRHVLVGSGPAAVSAAETIRALDPDALVTLVSAEEAGYYSRPGLAYLLAREVPVSGLFPFTAEEFDRLAIERVHGRVASIDLARRWVLLEDARSLEYDRLLLATGARAIPLEVPGSELDGVVKLDDMADADDLVARSRHARSAVVVGGGITALEIVEGLRERHVHVHYLLRKERYWGNVLSEEESRIVEDGLKARGVELHHFAEVARVVGRGGRVAGVDLVDGTHIPCEIVPVAVGVLPQIDLAQDAGLACARGVLVDEYLRASEPGVFAAGDIAEVREPTTGRPTIEVLWSSAVAKGRAAGHNMVRGPERAYEDGAPLNVTRLAGFKITIIGTVGSGGDSDLHGIARGDSETWRQLGPARIVETRVGDAHVRLALAGGVIVGAVVMGDQALSFPLQELISARADVSATESALTAPNAPLGELIEGVWREWKAARDAQA